MHLLSWNVASWPRTVKFIREQHGSVEAWMARHKVDVLCLQEVKTTDARLGEDAAAHGANARGFESFWCPSRTSKARGMNGVCTFAAKDTVLRADREPLGRPELDLEGRALMTEFRDLVVFNVYVPTGSYRMHYKLRFLDALQEAMRRERRRGKPVLLCGDLNISRRSKDVHWHFRSVMVDRVLAWEDDGRSHTLTKIQADLRKHWPTVLDKLARIEVKPCTVNTPRGKVQKWRIHIPDSQARLGQPFETEERARDAYSLRPSIVHDTDRPDSEPLQVYPANTLCVKELAECMEKCAGVAWSEDEQQTLADSLFVEFYREQSLSSRWLQQLLQTDDMVDVFAEIHPGARARFTCWEQYRNSRYRNEGSRIDYIIVDRAFFEKHRLPSYPPLPGAQPGKFTANSDLGALAAATANGLWKPAPFDGTGLVMENREAYETQFQEPGAGIVYTPPQYSDHVGVEVVLNMELRADPAHAAQRCKATRACMPHCVQRKISSFFAAPAAAAATGAAAASTSTSKRSRLSQPSSEEDSITHTASASQDSPTFSPASQSDFQLSLQSQNLEAATQSHSPPAASSAAASSAAASAAAASSTAVGTSSAPRIKVPPAVIRTTGKKKKGGTGGKKAKQVTGQRSLLGFLGAPSQTPKS